MNLLAATAPDEAKNEVYNVAVGDRTTLNDLFHALQSALTENGKPYTRKPVYRDFRAGDVRHSQADISKAASKLRSCLIFGLWMELRRRCLGISVTYNKYSFKYSVAIGA